MTYTFEQLKDDVRKEAEALRVHAKQNELDALNFDQLRPTHIHCCIYGQMTGSCFSKRAAQLIKKCTPRYFNNHVMVADRDLQDVELDFILKNANGPSVRGFIKDRIEQEPDAHYSAIEAYILLPEARNANLIAYLRGETETLDL